MTFKLKFNNDEINNCYGLDSKSWIILGPEEFCHFYSSQLCQVMIEDPWIFSFKNDEFSIYYQEYEELDFRIFSTSLPCFFSQCLFPHKLIDYIFKSSLFEKILHSIQKDNFNLERYHEYEFILFLIDYISPYFKVNCGISKNRLYFKSLIWCLYQHIKNLSLLTPLIFHEDISEIMIKSYDKIYVEIKGNIKKSVLSFKNSQQLKSLTDRIVSISGKKLDSSQPYCDLKLPDGSRFHAIMSPLVPCGPVVTIRKFTQKPLNPHFFIQNKTFNLDILNLFKKLIRLRKNILICGGTNSGKTTLLNFLCSLISSRERIITIEDSPELQIPKPHVISLESRLSNAENKGNISIRDLVKNALRMRPDRLIVGECRSSEAMDMLQAMNTGHSGSLTTLHASSGMQALQRLETLCLMANLGISSLSLKQQIISAIDYIIFQKKDNNGIRRVFSIDKVNKSSFQEFKIHSYIHWNKCSQKWIVN